MNHSQRKSRDFDLRARRRVIQLGGNEEYTVSSCCHAVSFMCEKPLGATVFCALAGLASAACPTLPVASNFLSCRDGRWKVKR